MKAGKVNDQYTLPLAMALGIIANPAFRTLTGVLPFMIFLMLYFTFCKIRPQDLRLHVWHWIVLSLQLALAFGVYYALVALARVWPSITPEVSQGLMLCFLMPTATAAPIIAGKLGGSIQNLTTFTILSNLATAIIVPLFFPLVYTADTMSFASAMWLIVQRVVPLLLGPFAAAWLTRLLVEYVYHRRGQARTFVLPHSWAQAPFYIWAGTLIILMADITYSLLHASYAWTMVVWLSAGALIACLLQFYMGHIIGRRWPAPSRGVDYHDVLIAPNAAPKTMAGVSGITAGQAFGQKNTTLGVWMAQTYLLPLAALGPAAYILWQNLYNSYQLHQASSRS